MNSKSLLKTAGIIGGVYAASSFLLFYEVMAKNAKLYPVASKLFSSRPEDAPFIPEPENDERVIWFTKQEFEEFSIKNSRGQNLKGYLLKADSHSDIYVFCSHGYRNTGKGEYNRIVKFYHDKGYNVFLVDHQAAGLSEGKYIGFGFFEHKDCIEWLHFINKTFGPDIKIIIHGISMGSATVMMMTGDDNLPENVKFAVADCGYTSAWHEFEHNIEFLGKPKYLMLYGSDFFNKIVSGYHFKDADAISAVKKSRVPILFIHGTKDDFVPTEMGKELYEACGSEKDLLLVEGAGHAESYPVAPEEYESKVMSFAEKYL